MVDKKQTIKSPTGGNTMHHKRSLRAGVVSRAILMSSAAAATILSPAAMAAIVTSPIANLTVPNNIDGIYINVVTGATGTSGSAVAGWDFNPYSSSGNLSIYWQQEAGAPVRNAGVGDTTTGPLTVLSPGATVGAANTYTSAVGASSSFRPTGDRIMGFRFFNSATGATNYGYARITTTGPGGFPATIVSIVYEDSGAPITIAGGAVPPQFAYTPAAGTTVTATGGGAVGSTGSLTITPSVGTAGSGTGAAATTTLTCTAPTAPFTGFGQTVTAIGAGAISGGPLSGSCTLGAAAATQTLTCNENRGGTANARTWTLNCPAGAALPLTSNPASGATVNAPGAIQVSNPNASPATVTCTAPAAPFSASPLSLAVPANGSASIQVSIGGVTPGSFTGTLNCTVGGSAQTLSFSLAGQVVAAPVAVPTGSPSGLALMALLLLLAGLGAFQLQRRS
jgi:hypothetical protein